MVLLGVKGLTFVPCPVLWQKPISCPNALVFLDFGEDSYYYFILSVFIEIFVRKICYQKTVKFIFFAK